MAGKRREAPCPFFLQLIILLIFDIFKCFLYILRLMDYIMINHVIYIISKAITIYYLA